jgi:uncharacterized lipoprotein
LLRLNQTVVATQLIATLATCCWVARNTRSKADYVDAIGPILELTSDEVVNVDVAKSIVIPAGHLQVKLVDSVLDGVGAGPDARRCKKHGRITDRSRLA